MQKLAEFFTTPDTWVKGHEIEHRIKLLPYDRFTDSNDLDKEFQLILNTVSTHAYCLSGFMKHKTTMYERNMNLMAAIVQELYPTRVQIASVYQHKGGYLPPGADTFVIRFNDHEDTTFSDIQRVAAEFDRRLMLQGWEEEDRHPIV